MLVAAHQQPPHALLLASLRTQDGPVRAGRGRVHRQHRHAVARLQRQHAQRLNQGALSRAGRPREADPEGGQVVIAVRHGGAAAALQQRVQEQLCLPPVVFPGGLDCNS
jgi:hypothetical protein